MFTILHTNDFHNRLTVDKAQRLQQRRAALGIQGLLLDAGDAVSAGNITYHPQGEPILELMSETGYDAMTVGNREFHFSRAGFCCTLSRASFPILCANVRLARSSPPDFISLAERKAMDAELPVRPFISRDIPNVGHVVLFGLTVPMITERMLARRVSAYIFEDPIRTAVRLVAQIRHELKPALLIALTHIGIQQDRALAASVPGIDLIVGGHTHVVLHQGEWVENTLIVQAGAFGRYYGQVEVHFEEDPGTSSRLNATLEAL